MFLGAISPASAQSADAGARIVAVAMADLGTYQGECFPWMRKVIGEATGIPMGYGYAEGYLTGGAVEVPLDDVRAGDVIQIADDEDVDPGADYPGLHTAIVLEQADGGKLRVIDSNSQWDGIVRIRNDYDPLASAETYSYLTARAYRFTEVVDGIVEVSQITVTPGSNAQIVTDGDCLRLRAAPGTGSTIVTCVADGTIVTVLDGTLDADGYTWQRIQAGSESGWVALIYLVGTSSTPTSPAPPVSAPSNPVISSGTISGSLPAGGGPGLVVWGGGGVSALISTAGADGCSVRSVWVTVSGRFIGYTNGAPAFVNAAWADRYPGDIPAQSPLIVICAGDPPRPNPTPPSSSPDAPVDGDGPPGPAGNEG